MEVSKRNNGTPLQVVCKKQDQQTLIVEFHDSVWAGHRGIWATFANLMEKYWWPGVYKDVDGYVETYVQCQFILECST